MQCQQRRRIKIAPLPSNRKMQMRACNAARASAPSNNLAALYFVPFLNFEFREVHIESKQALAVVHNHAITFVVEAAGQQDCAGVGGSHDCARGGVKIQSLMLAFVDSLENTRRSKNLGNAG